MKPKQKFHNMEGIVIFLPCVKPSIEPDYISKSGSMYWYGKDNKGDYVIRCSDHWCNARSTFNKGRSSKQWMYGQPEYQDKNKIHLNIKILRSPVCGIAYIPEK